MQHSKKFLGHCWWIFRELFVLLNQEITSSKKDLASSHSTKECRMESNSLRIETFTTLTSSILTSSKREIDRDNRLPELTIYWNYFVPILVLAYAGCQRLSVSVSLYFDSREKPLERSAVPLMEGGLREAQVFSEIIGFRWF